MRVRNSEKGMALIITLMMLAVVTFMAVIFLSISRRERTTVKIAEEQITSRRMADAATARATAELVGRMERGAKAYLNAQLPNTNLAIMYENNGTIQRAKLHYGLNVSRNYVNPNGFNPGNTLINPGNVSYTNQNGQPLAYGTTEYMQNVANLQYDARAPVYAFDPITGKPDTSDFRFYLDLNRNRTNEASGFIDPGTPEGQMTFQTALTMGDPEWIGVLERPDLPHSETNRFIGRYAYIVLPAGKSLDMNYIHNQAVNPRNPIAQAAGSRYSRNQGVGSFELNMAGFLVDFHKRVWWTNVAAGDPPANAGTRYTYRIFSNPTAQGIAFSDASGILGYRLNRDPANLVTPQTYFRNAGVGFPPYPPFPAGGSFWDLDLADFNADGNYVSYHHWYTNHNPVPTLLVDNDRIDRPWFGQDQPAFTGEYPDAQRFFVSTGAGTPAEYNGFLARFRSAVADPARTNNYDRYAYYRFLGQMGVDSTPALAGKIHLNFTNEPGTISTNLKAWVSGTNDATIMAFPTVMPRPEYLITNVVGTTTNINTARNDLTNFFLIAADAMLRRSLVTNVFLDNFSRLRTNYTVGGTYFTEPSLNMVPNAQRFIANFPVRHDISVTNIQIYHVPLASPTLAHSYTTNGEYSSAVHRILQLAANIYDNMTNAGPSEPFYPSVFRPYFVRTATNVYIGGFTFDPRVSTFPTTWITDEDFFRGNQRGDLVNIFGQPVVIGAKKGWPTFNELSLETFVHIGRKLEFAKAIPGANPIVETNQLFTIGMSNIFAIEAWNSFGKAMNRNIELRGEIFTRMVLQAGRFGVYTNILTNFIQSRTVQTPYLVQNWPGRQDRYRDRTNSIAANPPAGYDPSDFRLPIYDRITNTIPNLDFIPMFPYLVAPQPDAGTPTFIKGLATPDFLLHTTNYMYYLAIDAAAGRIVDVVSLEKAVSHINITEAMGRKEDLLLNASGVAFGNTNNADRFWITNLVDKANPNSISEGQLNQVLVSMGLQEIDADIWRNYNATSFDKTNGIRMFNDWMNASNRNTLQHLSRQAPFSPVRKLYFQRTFQVNDPLVRFMASDLRNPYQNDAQVLKPGSSPRNTDLGGVNKSYRPWGHPNGGPNNWMMQDYAIFDSDRWQFPIAKLNNPTNPQSNTNHYGIANFHYLYPNIGQLGRVHRGTPWQTVYLKSGAGSYTNSPQGPIGWVTWSGSWGTHPTMDWRLLDLFTTAMSENSARGLLSVNQTNYAAWSAVLSGVQVVTNSVPDNEYKLAGQNRVEPRFGDPNTGVDMLIEPGSVQLERIVNGINRQRSTRFLGVFAYAGEVLGTPELSIGFDSITGALTNSPYLNMSEWQRGQAFTDDALEAIPQRILSLLKADEPRVVVYAFGQTLKPAPRSMATDARFYNLCLNYQVAGEYATKTVLRVEGDVRSVTNPLRTVVESFEQLPPFDE